MLAVFLFCELKCSLRICSDVCACDLDAFFCATGLGKKLYAQQEILSVFEAIPPREHLCENWALLGYSF